MISAEVWVSSGGRFGLVLGDRKAIFLYKTMHVMIIYVLIRSTLAMHCISVKIYSFTFNLTATYIVLGTSLAPQYLLTKAPLTGWGASEKQPSEATVEPVRAGKRFAR